MGVNIEERAMAVDLVDGQISVQVPATQGCYQYQSLSLKAAEELSQRPKNGEIYDEFTATANLKSITKRISLRLLRKPEHEIELAGQMAHNGALLKLQSDMLAEKARELLAQSKRKLQSAVLWI
ncbi:hypothetical protein SESBI_32772 [Sesbania bispinosa]|nr:hypothetical protein SESBI_32772 [Sesbania bispinosa]